MVDVPNPGSLRWLPLLALLALGSPATAQTRLSLTDLEVRDAADTNNGAYLVVDAADLFRVFLPRLPGETTAFRGIRRGGTVLATGVAYQYCSRPPYNRYFQVLVPEPSAVSAVDHTWFP